MVANTSKTDTTKTKPKRLAQSQPKHIRRMKQAARKISLLIQPK